MVEHTTEPAVEAPKEVAVEMEPVSEAAATPAVATPNEPFDTAEKEKALPVDESLTGKRWYNQGQEYLNYEEFRECPMGVDILNGPAETAEQDLEAKFKTLTTEEVHRAAGGHWDLQEMVNTEKPWALLTTMERIETVVVGCIKFFAIWGVLYMFIISLGIMGSAFKVLGGRSSGRAFRESELLANPVAGLAIGILATVLMQSSSTTTSIVISMAAADLVSIKNAAYMIMGANIGTSVTNTIVSIAHLNSAAEYRRAFTGAVFHDMFNWLTVTMFLPLEASSGFLVELAGAAVDSLGISDDTEKRGKVDFIKKITKPATGRVVSVDKKLIEKIAAAETDDDVKELEKKTMIKQSSGHVLRDTPISDDEAGIMLLFASLTMLATCLLLLVKLLQSVLKGRVAVWTRYLLNIEFKHPILRSCGGFDNYILLVFGTGCTILVQSSSVFTSTLTPLIGIGLIHIEKAVALTHGANIGTTVTGVLSALSGSNVNKGLRVALEHVFFNCLGTVIWFVIWPLRPVPLNMAKFMGETAANLRWFPLVYILVCFLGFPGLIIALSIPGWEVLVGVMTPIVVIIVFTAVWVLLRRNRADLLPRSIPMLRADSAPCGCRYPNFMQLWGGDIDQDQVDLEEMREKEAERKAREAAVREWSYSPAAWGLAIMAFVGAVMCVPTSQWRRARYAQEEVGREEIGLGLWEVCSPAYESEMKLMAAPTSGECNLALLEQCASDLVQTCAADSEWATGSSTTDSEELAYHRAFTKCSKLGCRAYAFETACRELPSCKGKTYHADHCHGVVKNYAFYEDVNPDANGVTLVWAEPTGAVVQETVPHQSEFYTSPASSTQKVSSFALPTVSGTVPSVVGLAYNPCNGHLLGATARHQLEMSLDFAFTRDTTTKTVSMVKEPTMVTGIEDMGDVDVLDCVNNIFIGASASSAKLFVFNGTSGTTLATYDTNSALPAIFAKGGGMKSLAVSPSKEKVMACMASGLTDGTAALAYGRVVRCAVLNVTNYMQPTLLAHKFVMLSDAAEKQNTVELVGASWLSEDKVALLEKTSNESVRIVQADFSKGSNLTDLPLYDSSVTELEGALVDTAANVPQLYAARILFAKGVYPVPLTELTGLPSSLPLGRLAGMAVVNDYTVVVSEQGTGAADEALKVHVVQASGEEETKLGLVAESCPSTSVAKFIGGADCRDIDEICPEGDLAGDMEVVAGLVISGTLFLGLGTVLITSHSLWMEHGIFGKLLYPAAGTLTLAWILLLAAWAHMEALTQSNYGCYFQDEALRGGFVLHRGKLEYLFMASYSWAFCIYAWGMLTISLVVVWHRAISLLVNPHHAEEVHEKEEIAEAARSEAEEQDQKAN
eukprot:TRINITY_DN175_c0_g1_i6.p1 TRINITY_DN175_c0_g1~~TRINITY_DN175_c0_g1_i6.p1  ORF type:complete len:1367 (+),score=667.99 TRINITY_DN175_c0_g1_i6:46-4101(+)